MLSTSHILLLEQTRTAVKVGALLPSAADNIAVWLEADCLPTWVIEAIEYFVAQSAWNELNDRFYTTLAFGTGGLRGRTIGKVIAPSELGVGGPLGAPEHTAVGTAYLNDFNIIRSTIGLYRYTALYLKKTNRAYEVPKLVIAHDVRHFSHHFSALTAATWEALGGQSYVFNGPRSTPQLSFSVRYLKAMAGVVITASHNPPHDNGFKVYFEDGGQIVSPHAEGIMAEAQAVDLKEIVPFLTAKGERVHVLPHSLDGAFLNVLHSLVLDPQVFEQARPKIVFSSLHGTGQVSAVPALQRLGVELFEVPEQAIMDGRFPTVRSPNPENAEALTQAVLLAERVEADAALATDPDGDRMGAAIRRQDGSYYLLTGNQIGTVLAEHRIRSLKAQGWLPAEGSPRAAFIKTFVTTPLQAALAEAHGLKVVQTLTGFKWIGAKLHTYEKALKAHMFEAEGVALDYDHTDLATRAALHQRYSTFYVFGGEESYGSLATDSVRDKDASGACVLFAEMVATLKAQGKTVEQFLDEIYLAHGYYEEALVNLVHEGAAGAAKIHSILEGYRNAPPTEVAGLKVIKVTDFGREQVIDADGEAIPFQDFFMLELEDGSSYAVRGSGTEPKIKFYCFVKELAKNAADLPLAKKRAADKIGKLKQALS